MCVVLVSACGDSGGFDDVTIDPLGETPDCSSWVGETLTADELEFGCRVGNTLMGTGETECVDGRSLWWNDFGWGYSDDVFHAHEAGAEKVAPETERTTCTG